VRTEKTEEERRRNEKANEEKLGSIRRKDNVTTAKTNFGPHSFTLHER
jgi:hypothetical protein